MEDLFVDKDGKMALNDCAAWERDADGDVTCTRCGMEKALIDDPEHGALCPGCVREVRGNL